MRHALYEYDRGVRFGVASEETVKQYADALSGGKAFFLYPYHGYTIRMVVRHERSPEEEQDFFASEVTKST